MTQKKKNIVFLVLSIICAIVALSSAVGVGVAISWIGDMKEIVEMRIPEPAQQPQPIETEQATPMPTYVPSPEPAVENSAQTKSGEAESPKQKAVAEPAAKSAEQPKPEVKREITVYVTKYGECYHDNRNCYHIKNREVTALSLSEAKKLYRPCSHCAG